jgi:hypothetical protein
VAALRRYGLYDITGPAPGLVGVAVLSYPANDAVLLKPFPGLAQGDESAELGRLVLLDEVPANAESHFMAEVFRLAAGVGYRGIVSFSDPNPRYDSDGRLAMPGHYGIVYQALNARYTGDTGRRTVHVLPDGTVFNARAEQISCGAGAGTTARSRSERAAGPGAWSARTLDCLWRSSAAPPGTVTCGAIRPLAW